MKNKAAEKMYQALKDDPEAILAWCYEEIEAYRVLIALIEKSQQSAKAEEGEL